MSESTRPRSMVSADAKVAIRVRPAILLMIARARATGATVELGLAEVRQRAADAVRRLTRLGATRAWTGDPHSDEQADLDPMARMRAAVHPRHGTADPPERTGMNVAVAATWDIAGLPAEEVLLLVDRLRFDAAADAEPPKRPEDPPQWEDPTEQIQRMIAKAVEPPPEDNSPKFIYIGSPTEDQLAEATAEAYQMARRRAERLAKAAGLRLGAISSLSYSLPPSATRPDRLMADQRTDGLLSTIGYNLAESETASDDPRETELVVCVRTSHELEE